MRAPLAGGSALESIACGPSRLLAGALGAPATCRPKASIGTPESVSLQRFPELHTPTKDFTVDR